MKKITTLILTSVFAMAVQAASVDKLIDSNQSWNDAKLPSLSIDNTTVKVLRITIEAGEKLPVHKHPVVNVGYLTKGQLTVVTEAGKVLQLKAGDALTEVVDEWHHGENKGSTDAEIVVFYVGEEGQAVTIKK